MPLESSVDVLYHVGFYVPRFTDISLKISLKTRCFFPWICPFNYQVYSTWVCFCSGYNSHTHNREPINLARLLCMMIFIQFWCPIQKRQFTVILITGSLLLVNKISYYQLRFLSFFYALFKAPLLAAAFSALELLFSVSIPFELLASHPSLGSCNIFILNLPLPLKRKGKKSLSQ